ARHGRLSGSHRLFRRRQTETIQGARSLLPIQRPRVGSAALRSAESAPGGGGPLLEGLDRLGAAASRRFRGVRWRIVLASSQTSHVSPLHAVIASQYRMLVLSKCVAGALFLALVHACVVAPQVPPPP